MGRRTLPAGALLGTAAAPAPAAVPGPSGTRTGGTTPGSRRYTARHTAGRGDAVARRVAADTRVARDGVPSAVYREKSTGTTPSPPHVVGLRLPA
ncbi:hypothetical protein ACH5A7_16025 [Streptomyces sp. NPDC018955]|uniref:hypothetical protein n=1 Tax=Streptomyces sp. NPDC018955 TaxID=3365055 RepID=UPI0037A4B6FC